jgi:hypothetical protein
LTIKILRRSKVMGFIVGIVLLLAFIGIGLRISRAIGISFGYVVICIVCWIIGTIVILANEGITGKGMVIDIAIIVAFPIVLILFAKGVFIFIKWAIVP